MSKKNRIEHFLDSDREDYMEFIKFQIEDERVGSLEAMENSDKKEEVEQRYKDFSQEKKWMPNGIFGQIVDQPPYQELDFEAFSFNVLQHLSDNQDLNKTVDIVKDFERTPRRKELRIYLFESLRDPRSPYFDIQLYYDIREKMDEANRKVEQVVESNGFKVLTKGFDSHSFLSTDKEAEKVQQQANKKIDVADLQLESKASAVKFYNVAQFQERNTGEWYEVLTNGTPYDDTKREVVEALRNKDFGRAYEAISAGKKKHLKNQTGKPDNIKSKFKEYASTVREIQNSENHRAEE